MAYATLRETGLRMYVRWPLFPALRLSMLDPDRIEKRAPAQVGGQEDGMGGRET
jgi:hypothetical protein